MRELVKRNLGDILMILLLFAILILLIVKMPDEPTTSETETTTVHVCPPTVEKVTPPVQEPVYVEPQRTGKLSVYEVGMDAILDNFAKSGMTLCTWGGMAFTQEEIDLLRTTVFCEAGNQDLETQVMVALTILNRYKSGYADSIREVIYQDGAYAVTKWDDFESRGWTEQVEQAVDIALGVNEHPGDMYYFRTEFYHGFAQDYMVSGDLFFSTQKGDWN